MAEDVHTLTGAYALDALDADERAAFEGHLAGCAACREEVAALRETAARLTDGVAVAPPPALRARVLAEVRTTAQLPPPRLPGDEVAARRARRAAREGRGWMVAAAVAAVLALAGGGFGVVQWRAAQQAQQVADGITAVLADPTARRVTGEVTGGGVVQVVVAGDRAVLTTAGLPALPDDRVYQLWLLRGTAVTSAGLGPGAQDAAGAWQRPLAGVREGDQVAVSVEPRGGSQQPTTTPLVAVTV